MQLLHTNDTMNCQHLSRRVHRCMTQAHSSLERFLLWNMVCLRAAMRAAEPRRVAALKATLPATIRLLLRRITPSFRMAAILQAQTQSSRQQLHPQLIRFLSSRQLPAQSHQILGWLYAGGTHNRWLSAAGRMAATVMRPYGPGSLRGCRLDGRPCAGQWLEPAKHANVVYHHSHASITSVFGTVDADRSQELPGLWCQVHILKINWSASSS